MDNFSETSIADRQGEVSLGRRILPDTLAFAIGLVLAYCLEWETTDLVWSLRQCSLVLGYATILAAIASGAYIRVMYSSTRTVLKTAVCNSHLETRAITWR